jgi:hypothetical protein
VEVLLTCGFEGRCANLLDGGLLRAPIRVRLRRQACEQGVLPRQPCAREGMRPGDCTGSCDDPKILALLDDACTDYGHLACGTLIERVQANLVFDRVDDLA